MYKLFLAVSFTGLNRYNSWKWDIFSCTTSFSSSLRKIIVDRLRDRGPGIQWESIISLHFRDELLDDESDSVESEFCWESKFCRSTFSLVSLSAFDVEAIGPDADADATELLKLPSTFPRIQTNSEWFSQ